MIILVVIFTTIIHVPFRILLSVFSGFISVQFGFLEIRSYSFFRVFRVHPRLIF